MLSSSVVLHKSGNETIEVPNLTDRFLVPESITFSSRDIDHRPGDFSVSLILPGKTKKYSCAYFLDSNMIDLGDVSDMLHGKSGLSVCITNDHTKQNTISFDVMYKESYGQIIYQIGRALPDRLDASVMKGIAGSGKISMIKIITDDPGTKIEIIPTFTTVSSRTDADPKAEGLPDWMTGLELTCVANSSGTFETVLDFLGNEQLRDTVYSKFLGYTDIKVCGYDESQPPMLYLIAYGFNH